MENSDLEKLLTNPKFEIDLVKLSYKTHQLTVQNGLYLKAIAQQQIELKAILKEIPESEIEDFQMEKFRKMDANILNLTNQILNQDIQNFLKDE